MRLNDPFERTPAGLPAGSARPARRLGADEQRVAAAIASLDRLAAQATHLAGEVAARQRQVADEAAAALAASALPAAGDADAEAVRAIDARHQARVRRADEARLALRRNASQRREPAAVEGAAEPPRAPSPLARRSAAFIKDIETQRRRLADCARANAALRQRLRLPVPDEEPRIDLVIDANQPPDAQLQRLVGNLDHLSGLAAAQARDSRHWGARRWTTALVQLAVAVLHLAIGAAAVLVATLPAVAAWLGSAFGVGVAVAAVIAAALPALSWLITALCIAGAAAARRSALADDLAWSAAALRVAGDFLERIAADGASTFLLAPATVRVDRLLAAEEERGQAANRRLETLNSRLAAIDAWHRRLRHRLDARRDRALADRDSERDAQAGAVRQRQAMARERIEARRQRGLAGIAEIARERQAAIAAQRQAQLAGLHAACAAAGSARAAAHPAWDDLGDAPATAFPADLPLGRCDLASSALPGATAEDADQPPLRLPLRLALCRGDDGAAAGNLVIRSRAGGDQAAGALALLRGAVLRLLLATPPGRARCTIVDPVGLGERFAELTPLLDDERLLGGRIWTRSEDIDRRLAELGEHIERVIQQCLRDRHADIAAYNREAGDLAEPYRALVIADFPNGLSARALERLAAIVRSGPRCGVFTWLHVPAGGVRSGFDVAAMDALVLAADDSGALRVADGPLAAWAFTPEPAPAPATLRRLLDRLASDARAARRVEVSFALGTPAAELVWSRSSADAIEIPIGMASTARVRTLDLGRGTAQHVLIGGRTGSGKSTLLHALITNAALWYSPDELEFHLIDFKKGVEFKAYATHRLPHARVVAIESDREFALSVLRALDAELDRRGGLFRAAGVQDLGAWRRLPGNRTLPRALLVIDEFHEFFAEDDAIARDAALLLDRLVRQGRAFGVHAVLGSQSLGGVVAMAKSTLGQIGVRIALQCSEADSLLILSDDNPAARLLERPGEAIYNDRSGARDGNSPFQTFWLDDADQARRLADLAARAAAVAARDPAAAPRPLVVLEGNVPAELAANRELAALLARPWHAADAVPRWWLGEPNAIKGPVELAMDAGGCGNLLIVGQHREAALALASSALIALAARYRPGDARFTVINGEARDERVAAHLAAIAAALAPHAVELVAPAQAGPTVAAIAGGLAAGPSRPHVLIVLGLGRLKALGQEEAGDPFAARTEGASPGDAFASLLADGPEAGVRSIVWCDARSALTRLLSRRSLAQLGARVLFQMSPADSADLCDETAAAGLGLNHALLHIGEQGISEKFRPWRLPDGAFLAEVAAALRVRFAPTGGGHPSGGGR